MFQLLEHPSDIGILARGTSREDALIEASKGLVSILVNPENFHPIEERDFKATGSDSAAQVIDWLNEILFFFDTEGMVFVEFAIDSWTPDEIAGRARGEHFDIDRQIAHRRKGRNVSSIRGPSHGRRRLGISGVRGRVRCISKRSMTTAG